MGQANFRIKRGVEFRENIKILEGFNGYDKLYIIKDAKGYHISNKYPDTPKNRIKINDIEFFDTIKEIREVISQ